MNVVCKVLGHKPDKYAGYHQEKPHPQANCLRCLKPVRDIHKEVEALLKQENEPTDEWIEYLYGKKKK